MNLFHHTNIHKHNVVLTKIYHVDIFQKLLIVSDCDKNISKEICIYYQQDQRLHSWKAMNALFILNIHRPEKSLLLAVVFAEIHTHFKIKFLNPSFMYIFSTFNIKFRPFYHY